MFHCCRINPHYRENIKETIKSKQANVSFQSIKVNNKIMFPNSKLNLKKKKVSYHMHY